MFTKPFGEKVRRRLPALKCICPGKQVPFYHIAHSRNSLLRLDVLADHLDQSLEAGGVKMRDPTVNGGAQIDAESRGIGHGDQLDKAGQSILRSASHRPPAWLKKTAATHSIWLRSFRTNCGPLRIASLSSRRRPRRMRDRADRAEQWLHKVYTEIEDRFLRQKR